MVITGWQTDGSGHAVHAVHLSLISCCTSQQKRPGASLMQPAPSCHVMFSSQNDGSKRVDYIYGIYIYLSIYIYIYSIYIYIYSIYGIYIYLSIYLYIVYMVSISIYLSIYIYSIYGIYIYLSIYIYIVSISIYLSLYI